MATLDVTNSAASGAFSFCRHGGAIMKRDVELCRKLMLAVEAEKSPWSIAGYSRDALTEHVRLLSEAGFLKVTNLADMDGDDFRVDRLTWNGHEFLDAARNESVWQSVRSDLKKKAADVPLSVLFEVLKKSVAAMFGI